MRASVMYAVGDPSVLTYGEAPDPHVGPTQVLVEVSTIGLQGGDTLRRSGAFPLESFPHVVGYQASGIIREVGREVVHFREGDRVVVMVNNGSHAELLVADASAVFTVPDDLDLSIAAAVPIEFGTADEALTRGGLSAGESVLVTGAAGGVGLAAIQLAKRAGARTVIATASSSDRAERLREFGADHVVDYSHQDVEAMMLEATNGVGVDLVVDQVGGSMLDKCARGLAYRGRVSWVGQSGREVQRSMLWPLVPSNATLHGVHFGQTREHDSDRTARRVEGIMRLVADGILRVEVDSRFPLSEASAAHERAESRQAFGRILISP